MIAPTPKRAPPLWRDRSGKLCGGPYLRLSAFGVDGTEDEPGSKVRDAKAAAIRNAITQACEQHAVLVVDVPTVWHGVMHDGPVDLSKNDPNVSLNTMGNGLRMMGNTRALDLDG